MSKMKLTVAEKIVKELQKKLDIKSSVSDTCAYPYWNGEGSTFVRIESYMNDAPYSGYTRGGPELISWYRKSYLGATLSKIATIVKRFDKKAGDGRASYLKNNKITLHKEFGDFFIRIDKGYNV